MNIYAINVVFPLGYRQRKHTVKMCIVMAESAEQAMTIVAAQCDDNERLFFRNIFQPSDVITWDFQTWDKTDIESANIINPRSLAPYKYASTEETA